jgi:hypothetical protein
MYHPAALSVLLEGPGYIQSGSHILLYCSLRDIHAGEVILDPGWKDGLCFIYIDSLPLDFSGRMPVSCWSKRSHGRTRKFGFIRWLLTIEVLNTYEVLNTNYFSKVISHPLIDTDTCFMSLQIAPGDNRGREKFHSWTNTMSQYDPNNELFTSAIFHFHEKKKTPPPAKNDFSWNWPIW